MERRSAIKAPPAETFSALANSSNSLPFSSRLRTKTGMARGSRLHLRRSVSGLRDVNGGSSNGTYCTDYRIFWAKPVLCGNWNPSHNARSFTLSTRIAACDFVQNQVKEVRFAEAVSALLSTL